MHGPPPARTDTVVVGAGLSGLAVAEGLAAAGREVHVVEAAERLGGRIWTEPAPLGVVFERGAQWVGASHRAVRTLAASAGLSLRPMRSSGRVRACIDGHPQPTPSVELPMGFWARSSAHRFARKAERLAEELARGDPRAHELDSLPADVWLQQMISSRKARETLAHALEAALCAPLCMVSARDILADLSSVGGFASLESAEETTIEGGAGQLIQTLALRVSGRIHLQTAVRAIEREPTGITLHTARGSVRAERVVLAIPAPQILRIAWTKPLPRPLANALAATVSGAVVKTTLIFETAWWRQAGWAGHAVYADDLFTYQFDTGGDAPGVLTALSAGRAAQRLRALTDEQVVAELQARQSTLFGCRTTSPVGSRVTRWFATPLSPGGYASRSALGSYTLYPHDLWRPLRAVHFSGSETAPQWRGYMEGALLAAERTLGELGQPR